MKITAYTLIFKSTVLFMLVRERVKFDWK